METTTKIRTDPNPDKLDMLADLFLDKMARMENRFREIGLEITNKTTE